MDALLRRTRRDSASGYAGVTLVNGARWLARIRVGQEVVWHGQFDTIEEAHAARTAALARLHPATRAVPPPEPAAVSGARWVPLNRGRFALVDAADFERVIAAGKWRFSSQGYAKLDVARGVISLQAFILEPPPGFEVDHVNRTALLDCRRENLRVATRTENIRNRGKNRNNTSGYKGVTWSKRAKKWQAQASEGKKHVHLGLFATAEEAARARDSWILEHHGAFASLNFPSD